MFGFTRAQHARQPAWDFVAHHTTQALGRANVKRLDPVLRWTPGTSPFSTHVAVTSTIGGYLLALYVGQRLMKNRQPMQLKPLFMLHNALLSAASLLVLVLMLEQVAPIVWRDGFFAAICAQSSWTPQLVTLYIFNYLFKYWELLDTLFLVVKKKPLQFLHVFHHAATATLCYTQLNGRTSVSWVPITLNLTVHVLMYYYYFATTAMPGRKIWWKRYLTAMQITQFVVDVVVIYFATYSYFAATYFSTSLPTMGSCAGTEGAALFGASLLTSYLFLFIAFYQRTYKSTDKAAKGIKGRARAFSDAVQDISAGFGPGGAPALPIGKSSAVDSAAPVERRSAKGKGKAL